LRQRPHGALKPGLGLCAGEGRAILIVRDDGLGLGQQGERHHERREQDQDDHGHG
jgi:hypothetical protein